MRVYLRWILEKELERRETARERARATWREKGDPYLGFGVDSRAPLQQRSYRFRMSVLGGNVKRSGPALLHRRSGARHLNPNPHSSDYWTVYTFVASQSLHNTQISKKKIRRSKRQRSKWYFVNVERGNIADKLRPRNINVSFTNNSNVAIDVTISSHSTATS